jgi:hypothetical protein
VLSKDISTRGIESILWFVAWALFMRVPSSPINLSNALAAGKRTFAQYIYVQGNQSSVITCHANFRLYMHTSTHVDVGIWHLCRVWVRVELPYIHIRHFKFYPSSVFIPVNRYNFFSYVLPGRIKGYPRVQIPHS